MTIAKLYENHKKGTVSKQAFLYEARKDDNLPWVNNLTSYEDAVKILKNKGIISEVNLNVPGAIGSSNQRVQHNSYSSNAEIYEVTKDSPEEDKDIWMNMFEDAISEMSLNSEENEKVSRAMDHIDIIGIYGMSKPKQAAKEFIKALDDDSDSLNELSPQTRYNAAIKAINISKTSGNNAAGYKKSINQGNKFLTQIDPEVKNVVDKFAKSLGLQAKIEKDIANSTYEPSISIKMIDESNYSSGPQISVFITKYSNEIKGQLPDQASERRLGNIIKQIQQKELNIELDKDSLNEAHDLNTDQIIDRLNVYKFKKGVDYEMSKLKALDNVSYEKVREKVAKKMAKDPLAYRYTQLANAKQIEKDDKRLAMTPVQANNLVDKDNGIKKIKGHADEKKNTSTSKTENRKGKPKGVKEMKGSKKKPAGVKEIMKSETQETVINEMLNFFKKKDRLKENEGGTGGGIGGATPQERTDFYKGHECMTPDGIGIVVERKGSIVSVQLEDGSEKDYTLNVLDAAKEKQMQSQTDNDKAARDQMWANWDKRGEKTFGGMTADPKSSTHDLLKKLKGLVEKLKIKKEGEAIKDKAGNITYASDAEAGTIVQNAAKKGIRLTRQKL